VALSVQKYRVSTIEQDILKHFLVRVTSSLKRNVQPRFIGENETPRLELKNFLPLLLLPYRKKARVFATSIPFHPNAIFVGNAIDSVAKQSVAREQSLGSHLLQIQLLEIQLLGINFLGIQLIDIQSKGLSHQG
jgi:hypothetical protein